MAPDGMFLELDRDEFEEGVRQGLLTPYQHQKANQVFEILVLSVTHGYFFAMDLLVYLACPLLINN